MVENGVWWRVYKGGVRSLLTFLNAENTLAYILHHSAVRWSALPCGDLFFTGVTDAIACAMAQFPPEISLPIQASSANLNTDAHQHIAGHATGLPINSCPSRVIS